MYQTLQISLYFEDTMVSKYFPCSISGLSCVVISAAQASSRSCWLECSQWAPDVEGAGLHLVNTRVRRPRGKAKLQQKKNIGPSHQSNVGQWMHICPFKNCIINTTLGQNFWWLSAPSMMDCQHNVSLVWVELALIWSFLTLFSYLFQYRVCAVLCCFVLSAGCKQ